MKWPWWYEAIIGTGIFVVWGILALTKPHVDSEVHIIMLTFVSTLFGRAILKKNGASHDSGS